MFKCDIDRVTNKPSKMVCEYPKNTSLSINKINCSNSA